MTAPASKSLPKSLTSYDFLKTFAVLTMIIDHIGYYFFPEQLEWRIVGRMSMPVWMFLIGYARSREITPLLWLGGGLIIIGDVVAGMPLLALNILFTIIVVRLVLNPLMDVATMNRQTMFMIIVTLAILVLPTVFIMDYGTQALLVAMLGYMVRNQQKLGFSNEAIMAFMGVVFIIYMSYQKLIIGFNTPEAFTTGAGVLLVFIALTQFKSVTFPEITEKMPHIFVSLFQLMGRYTLEIYVAHLLLFKALGLITDPERYQLFNWGVI
jgi:hypothetical protein